MSKDDLQKKKRMKAHAKELLEDELLKLAFDEMEQEILNRWKLGASVDAREEAHHLYILLDLFRRKIGEHISRGKLAERRLEQMK